MVTRIWDTALDANILTSYAKAAALMKQQRIPPIFGWEAAAKTLEQWLVVTTFLIGPQDRHPEVFELSTLLTAADEVSSRLRAQAAAEQDMPATLIRLIQTEFNESLRQALTIHLPVRWPHLTPLIRTFITCQFHPGIVTMPGGFRQSIPTTVTPHRQAGLPHNTSTTPHQ